MYDELEKVKFDEKGLIPAIVQDATTKEVLTLAYMNEDLFGEIDGIKRNMVL